MASELHVDAIKHSGGTSAMTIDSSGRVKTPARPTFRARRINNLTLSGGNDTQNLIMNAVDFDVGNGYNTSTGIYTVPLGGIYFFFLNVRFDNVASGAYSRAIIHNDKSGATSYTDLVNVLGSIVGTGMSTNYHTINASGLLQCETNDTIKFLGGDNADSSIFLHQESQCGGFLVG